MNEWPFFSSTNCLQLVLLLLIQTGWVGFRLEIICLRKISEVIPVTFPPRSRIRDQKSEIPSAAQPPLSCLSLAVLIWLIRLPAVTPWGNMAKGLKQNALTHWTKGTICYVIRLFTSRSPLRREWSETAVSINLASDMSHLECLHKYHPWTSSLSYWIRTNTSH